MSAYYVIQFKPKGPKYGWKIFRRASRIQVYYNEEKAEKMKKQRESLGSVNLRADEETQKYETEIKKMEDDRADLYSAIVKLKTSIDELPQFFNVLLGHMSVVGPRPSPYEENQFCPPWREERLSVRPGITGLWQVKRSRIEGLDFQEWIRYDLEYVKKANFGFDLWIIYQTVCLLVRRLFR